MPFKDHSTYGEHFLGSFDKKAGRRFHLLLRQRWHLLPPILSNEPGNCDCGLAAPAIRLPDTNAVADMFFFLT
jgi:hypothetical protein